jgi:hypothetical protein
MNICTNPDSIQEIEISECVGLSLPKFNNNFSLLEDGACENSDYLETMYSTYENVSSEIRTLSSLLPGISRGSLYYYISGDDQAVINSGYFLKGFSRDSTGVFTLSFLNNFNDTDYLVVGTAATGTRTESPTALVVTPIIFTNQKVTINIGRLNNTTVGSTTTLMNPDYLTVSIYH